MTGRLMALVALMVAADPQAQNVPSRIGAGESVEICGVVTSVVSGQPSHCDATLAVKTSEGVHEVVIAAPLRRKTPGATRALQGATACFSGIVQLQRTAMTIRVSSFDAVRVTGRADTTSVFGTGANDSCETGAGTPRLLSEAKPRYPSEAMRERVQGVVWMDAVVDVTGAVSDVQVTRPLDPRLDEEAVKALRQWKFAPATLDGRPVAVIVSVEMSFALGPPR
ncbi:MAG TPA: energy transducer TonB [Vicinamibacterales bacterium]|nr:energy transducer TonB [Vicinamibacterales bacterium]